jgi:hypothetical protein
MLKIASVSCESNLSINGAVLLRTIVTSCVHMSQSRFVNRIHILRYLTVFCDERLECVRARSFHCPSSKIAGYLLYVARVKLIWAIIIHHDLVIIIHHDLVIGHLGVGHLRGLYANHSVAQQNGRLNGSLNKYLKIQGLVPSQYLTFLSDGQDLTGL